MWRWQAGPYTSGGATRVVGLYFRFGFWLHRMGIEPRTCTPGITLGDHDAAQALGVIGIASHGKACIGIKAMDETGTTGAGAAHLHIARHRRAFGTFHLHQLLRLHKVCDIALPSPTQNRFIVATIAIALHVWSNIAASCQSHGRLPGCACGGAGSRWMHGSERPDRHLGVCAAAPVAGADALHRAAGDERDGRRAAVAQRRSRQLMDAGQHHWHRELARAPV